MARPLLRSWPAWQRLGQLERLPDQLEGLGVEPAPDLVGQVLELAQEQRLAGIVGVASGRQRRLVGLDLGLGVRDRRSDRSGSISACDFGRRRCGSPTQLLLALEQLLGDRGLSLATVQRGDIDGP